MSTRPKITLFILFFLIIPVGISKSTFSDYLYDFKAQLELKWPENKTMNLVFHGHSVPAGYFKTPVVNTLLAYPHLN